MNGLNYIYAIIRDDNQRFQFDQSEFYLSEDNSFFTGPSISSTDLEYSDVSGGEMIGQRNSTYNLELNGLIVPRATDFYTLYSKLRSFFQINHTYTIVTVRSDGTMTARRNAWLANGDGLQIEPTSREDGATFNVEFTIGDVNTYEYAEDSDGNEIYANVVNLPLISASSGGKVWDDVGAEWDEIGDVWEAGFGGIQTITVNSSVKVYPVWTIVGPCVSPSLTNNTTDTNATYNGSVAEGQTLVIDMSTGTAKLNGAVVSRNLIGQVSFAPGDNQVGFDSGGGGSETSTISWNNIIN